LRRGFRLKNGPLTGSQGFSALSIAGRGGVGSCDYLSRWMDFAATLDHFFFFPKNKIRTMF